MNSNDNDISANELMDKILSETKRYNEAIKNDRPFFEAMEIRKEIKKLTWELKRFLHTHDFNDELKNQYLGRPK
jgi:hypothetical protein